MRELPKGWEAVELRDVCDLNPGKPDSSRITANTQVSFVPMAAVEADLGKIANPTVRPYSEVSKGFTAFQDGDVIMAKITPCMENGKAAVARDLSNGFGFGSTEFHVFRNSSAILPEYLFYFIRQDSFRGSAEANMTGSVGQKRVPGDFLKETILPLPPLNEQYRIVEKLEKLVRSVDGAQVRLATTPGILKRFRQSVLAAACSGRLTVDWREDNPKVEQAMATIDELKATAHVKVRRGVPENVEVSDQVLEWELPEKWAAYSTAELLRCGAFVDVKDGNHGANHPKVSEFTKTGLPFITAAQVNDYRIDYEGAYKLSGKPLDRIRVGFAKSGDVIYTHKGSVGRVAVADRECLLTPQTTYYRVNPEAFSSHFVMFYLASQSFSEQVNVVKEQTTRDFVPISEQYLLFHRVPPLAEQEEIVHRVEALFKTADALEARYRKAIAHVDKLKQSILAKAFRGELVVQDENDEPAAVLLERIRTERALQHGRPKLVAVASQGTEKTKARPHSKGIFYRRAALDCYVIEKLAGDPHLGRTKLEKISHLMEHHCDIDLEREPIRDAAGPNDYPSRIRVESLAKKLKWYSTHKRESGAKIDYLTGPNISKSRQTAINFLGQRQTKVDALLSLLRPLDTKRVEVVATLYASWNDFLLAGKTPTDDEVIHDVLSNWHPDKQLIPIESWIKTLGWMRRKELVPKGTGRPVTHRPPKESPQVLLRPTGQAGAKSSRQKRGRRT